MSEFEPLDPALASLLAGEKRPSPRAPEGSRERARQRLDAALGGGVFPPRGGDGSEGGGAAPEATAAQPSPQPTAPRATPRAPRFAWPMAVVAAFVAGIGAGALWSPRSRPPAEPARSGAPLVQAPPPTTLPSEAPAPPAEAAASAPLPASAAPTGTPSAGTGRTPSATASLAALPESTLAHERALLDAAHTALLRRDARLALETLAKHASRHPNGQLAEERDVLRIQALALAGRDREARAASGEFRRRYPSSVLLPTVDAALRSAP